MISLEDFFSQCFSVRRFFSLNFLRMLNPRVEKSQPRFLIVRIYLMPHFWIKISFLLFVFQNTHTYPYPNESLYKSILLKTTVVTEFPFLPPNVKEGVGMVSKCLKCVENMVTNSCSVQLHEVIMNRPSFSSTWWVFSM